MYISHGSIVNIANSYRLDDWRVRVWVPIRSRILISSYRPDRLWGPSSFLSNRYRDLLGTEVDNSPPTNAKINKMWIYTSIPSLCFHDVVLSKAQGQFNHLYPFILYVYSVYALTKICTRNLRNISDREKRNIHHIYNRLWILPSESANYSKVHCNTVSYYRSNI
jgi:hypothetical protein